MLGAWRELVDTARRTTAEGLVVGTSGNVSVRVGETVLVTPSGVPYDRLGTDDLCAVDLEGRRTAGSLEPTSELPMHLAVYRHTNA
ncbi:MAG TPA: class II aldolase/adducin family protein, partial [Streptomyces sp.]|nr:class II aldolase/adducin family protein [Streptomyces sp.]